MKIAYIVKTRLHYYPPCVSQIRMLKDLGYEVDVLYGTSDHGILSLLEKEGISNRKISEIHDVANGPFQKIKDWYKFRIGVLKALNEYPADTILWFGTAESAIPLFGALENRKYVVSLLELLDDSPMKRKLLGPIVKKASAVTVCEETRGYIMRWWWGLKELPYVFPNKPYNQITDRCHAPSIPETKAVIDRLKGKKVILYQGILQNTDEIIEVAKALTQLNTDYTLLLMGIDKYNSVEKIKKIYNNVEYVSYIPAPYHLEVTSYAHIGIVFYRNDSLNKAFCAPNKIYEYSGFGIPMLANNIPGLRNTVGTAGAAECINLTEENIIIALNTIEKNYQSYSQNAKLFFNMTDNLHTTKILMESLLRSLDVPEEH